MRAVSSFAALAALASASSSGQAVDPLVKGVLRANPVSGLCDTVKQEAGYFNIDPATNKNYFYWFFESRGTPSTDPLVLWLTGGPGCSSMLALLMENGPCSVKEDGSGTVTNPYSWNAGANVIWLDQPAGAGFSYSDKKGYDSNQAEVSADVYRFLQAFLAAHPELQGRPFYVTGESYGGHYVPSVSYAVYSGNQNLTANPGDVYIPLAGLAIGNGLTDPLVQYQYYAQMAYNFSASYIGHPTITLSDYQGMVAAWPQCQSQIAQCQTDTSACPGAQSFCNDAMFGPYEMTGLDVYNINMTCAVPPLCTDMTGITTWLNTPSVQQALGVKAGITWAPCNDEVNSMFSHDWMKRLDVHIPDLLANGTQVLIYAGDLDFICNWLGNQAWTRALQWPGAAGFNKAPVTHWVPPGSTAAAGELQQYQNFHFLRVYRAGHMVPSDQPAAAQAMINAFIAGKLQ